MSTDWTDRDRAIDAYERIVKEAKSFDDADLWLYTEALAALRRSADHTAIQTLLQTAISLLRDVVDEGECGKTPEQFGAALASAKQFLAEQDDPKLKRRYWGYRHSSGAVIVKRFFGDYSKIDAASANNYVLYVVEPFEADSAKEALDAVEKRTRSRRRN